MQRQVESEILDELPSEDPRARHSRTDLRRLNRLMGNVRTIARQIQKLPNSEIPGRVIELGAGDGTFLLRLARLLGPEWNGTEALLVDRQNIVTAETIAVFEDLGWRARVEQSDVLEWLHRQSSDRETLMLANLFLHHFSDDALRQLFQQAAGRVQAFVACEPRRSGLALAGARLVKWIGCNEVTQNDAVISVRAGFNKKELSELWPESSGWELIEGSAGLFSHVFFARRKDGRGA